MYDPRHNIIYTKRETENTYELQQPHEQQAPE